MHFPHSQHRQRCTRLLLLVLAVLAAAAALPAVSAQATQQTAGLSSVPQGITRMERVDDAPDELLRPIRHLGLPWAENMTEVLRKHLNQNLQASKRRMRRSSADDGDELAAAAAAAGPDAAAAQASTCALNATAASLVDGYLSHSADLFSTYTRIYDRLTMFYQDNRAGEDAYLLPDTILEVTARRISSAVAAERRRRAAAADGSSSSSNTSSIQITYVVVSLSSGWSVEQSQCNNPSGCKAWGSKIYGTHLDDADLRPSIACKQSHCWEAAECKSSSGACFLRVTVLEYHPQLGFAAQSSNVVRLVPDNVRPANSGNTQRAAMAMCSPCSTLQCA
ncbi:hypothetical protein COO60DRAFT_1703362, partial [Scenedesmus sp. NREL 46B-D3]